MLIVLLALLSEATVPSIAIEQSGRENEFGEAAAVCASALQPGGIDTAKLKQRGWIELSQRIKSAHGWQRNSISINYTEMFGGFCVIGGNSELADMPLIEESMKISVGQAVGADVVEYDGVVTPDANRPMKTYFTKNLRITQSFDITSSKAMLSFKVD